jgi:CRISPR-associated protein Csb2
VTLILDIEFLTGLCRAARGPGDTGADWPPQPDRIFSALVAAWAGRGEQTDERDALRWLEAQPVPTVHASGAAERTAPDVFVPPNDARASSAAKTYIQVLPDHRRRQPRRFPIARPDDPQMALSWETDPDAAMLATLDRIARDISFIGHSASFVRCRFRVGEIAGLPEGRPARRRIYPGRLAELERAYAANPVRPIIPAGASVAPPPRPEPTPAADWLVLEALDPAPDIRAAAPLCRALRKALMGGYARAGLGDTIPAAVSGHDPDGRPTTADHVAIVPMSFAGFAHSDGRLMGFAIVPPRGVALLDIPGLREAFAAVAPRCPARERRVLTLQGPRPDRQLRLSPVGSLAARSLDPSPYLESSRRWASVTPMVLDRHLKDGDEAEMRGLVAQACVNVGLPRPDPERILVDKHSAVAAAAPARRRGPPWTRWRMTEALASRPLTHAVIYFDVEVAGPVLLGAGRFTGLGLFRALDR